MDFQRKFRDCLSCFATGVAVVTAKCPAGRPAAVTINSFSSLSLDPPLVLWSIANSSGSFRTFTEADRFLIHILSDAQKELSNRFAGRGEDKYDNAPFVEAASGLPSLERPHAVLSCERYAVHAGGDHALIIGKVVDFAWEVGAAPLIYYRGGYRTLAA